MSTRGGRSSSKKGGGGDDRTLEQTDNSLDDNDLQHVHDDLETVDGLGDMMEDMHNNVFVQFYYLAICRLG